MWVPPGLVSPATCLPRYVCVLYFTSFGQPTTVADLADHLGDWI